MVITRSSTTSRTWQSIVRKMSNGYTNEFTKFVQLNELASADNDGRILFATDDFFAVAENLLKDEEPVWKENEFTEYGKWMDGWETRRKRRAGHDWTIIALGQPSIVEGFCVDTAYFTGNYAPRFSIQGARLTETDAKKFPERISKVGSSASDESLKKMSELKTENWKTLVPMTELKPGYPNTRKSYFAVDSIETWTHLRLNLYPDGGIARLRVYGTTSHDWSVKMPETMLDLIARENGGTCEEYSNAHYGHPRNLIKGGKASSMADGWETARRLDRPPVIRTNDAGIIQVPGEEWAIFKLGHVGTIESIIVDTTHFKGNFPDSAKVEGALIPNNRSPESPTKWTTILPSKKMSPNKTLVYTYGDLTSYGPFSHVKMTIAPDGGLSRFKLLGYARG